MDNTITTLEMCAGYGGIGLGLKNIFGERLRTIAYCELEGFAQANLISKMEAGLLDAAPIWSDLKTFPYGSFHGLVDILIAGYPCQPFSAAGKRAGKDDPRHLWPWIADGIRLLQPRLCLFENVEGHISLGLREVLGDLGAAGYTAAWGIFSASEVGAPHQRKRTFILAYDSSVGIQRCGSDWLQEPRPHAGQGLPVRGGDAGGVWPSRPGEPQHAWEPPRVVGAMANTMRKRSSPARTEQNEECPANSAVASSGAEAMGNAAQWKDHGRESRDMGQAAGEGRCGDDAADGTGEVLGNTNSPRPQERPRQRGAGIQGTDTDGGEDAGGEIKSSMGDPVDGTKFGVGLSELSGLSDSELAEICEWMVKTDNRTDELRLLGNGVVPATAERAFRVLWEELNQ